MRTPLVLLTLSSLLVLAGPSGAALAAVPAMTNVPLFVLVGTDAPRDNTPSDLRAHLESGGYRLDNMGPIGTNPGYWTMKRGKDAFTGVYTTLGAPTGTRVPIAGQYWSLTDAEAALEELDLRYDIGSRIMQVAVPARVIPGTAGQYVEVRLPVLDGQQAMGSGTGPRVGVYAVDTQEPGDSNRATMLLGIADGTSGWGSVVQAVSGDPATFTVTYNLQGAFRSMTFPDDPHPAYGVDQPLDSEASMIVAKAFPKVPADQLRIYTANLVGIAYHYSNGHVMAHLVHHAGETWAVDGEIGPARSMTLAEFQAPAPDFATVNVTPPQQPYF